MVENGHQGVIELAYDNPGGAQAGLELLEFDVLRRRLRPEVARRPSRPDFHQLILVRGGTGTAVVDFVRFGCMRGTLLHQRPGQVQRLPYADSGRPAELDATLVLFRAEFPPPLPGVRELLDTPGPVARRLEPATYETFVRAVAELDEEYRGPADPALLRQLLGALLLRIARLPGGAAPQPSSVYLAFRAQLERDFATTRSVEHYAARLGYSPRTLTRACLAATGRSAKQLADARVALEAQRLLAHTDQPVAAIARTLGFTEPTNFGKFFVRETGRTPGAFRQAESGAVHGPTP